MTHEAATTARELPEALPPGERILWQGAPAWKSLFRTAFHGQTLAIYFGVLLLLRGANVLNGGGDAAHALLAMLWLTPLAIIALGLIALIAWLSAKQTWYTITDKRLVMRIGIVLEITFNFPFRTIGTVDLRLYRDGSGDVPITLASDDRIAYLHLWPHARPWRFKQTQPMMRALPDPQVVADLLAQALVASTGGTAHTPFTPRQASSGSKTTNREISVSSPHSAGTAI